MKKLLFAGVAVVFLMGCNEVVEPCDGHENGAVCNGKSVVTCQNGEVLPDSSLACPKGCKDGECIK